MTALFVIVTAILAAARLTRLVTVDKITEPIRDRIIVRFSPDPNLELVRPPESKLVYLVHCPWCFGLWVAAAVWPTTWYVCHLQTWLHVTAWWAIPAGALALSQLIGLARGLESTD